MKIKVNDTVLVITGKDKGKTGKITKVDKKNNRVVVEQLNLRTKHIKKRYNQPGEKIVFEAPMDASNVMVIDPKTNKPSRVGYKVLETGKKERVAKVSGEALDATKSGKSNKKVKA